jgi:DNA ligase-1
LVHDVSELEDGHIQNIEKNYEGTIIRNQEGQYKCKFRSMDLLKYKNFMDDEFKIIGFDGERDTHGDHEPLILWICQIDDGSTFSVRPQGNQSERRDLYRECVNGNFYKYNGKNLWVKYFERTDKNIPRFPTTKTNSVQSYIREMKI